MGRETKKKFIRHTSRLGITGNQNQPIENKDFLLLYNGEIYNDWKDIIKLMEMLNI